MSLLAARASPSSETHMVVKAMSELTSLPTFPVPRPPRWKVARPRESNRGATRATWSGSPPTMKTSWRLREPIAPPVRGASTRWQPPASRRRPTSRTVAGELVVRSTSSEPGAAPVSHSSDTAAMMSGVGSERKVISACSATSRVS